MNYDEKLTNISILGAAGKMGSGILLLTAVEITDLNFRKENQDKVFVLNAIDISNKALSGLIEYVRVQIRKIAEKKIIQLREMYKENLELVNNSQIIDDYIGKVLANIRTSTRMETAYNSEIIFEAVNENPELKIKLFTQIDDNSKNQPWYFTNTSSVPISYLNEKANLGGRIIGFHFYNPPAIQKLVELINSESTLPEITEFAQTYAKNLKKFVVNSNDIAGFIGNGHFMRDALFGIKMVEELQEKYGFAKSVYIVNKITQDYMIRPMGIFQLIDYVGIDVCIYIMSVMNPYFVDEEIHSELLDKLFEMNIRGGQNSDGTQKDGFFKYQKGKMTNIFDFPSNAYVNIEDVFPVEEILGQLPKKHLTWKKAIKIKENEDPISEYFYNLKDTNSLGAELSIKYMKASKAIGEKLVTLNVAKTEKDVNDVMKTGFFHAYGPINNYLG